MQKKCLNGLSLLEILIASLIMSLVMLGLVNVFMSSKRYIIGSRSQATAGELIRYYLGNFSLQVNQSQWDSNCLSNNSLCSNPDATVLNNITYSIQNLTSSIVYGSLRKIRFNLTWTEPEP